MRMLIVLGFLLTIPLANWLIGHVGTTCITDGPCLVPVLPGLMAPSGVLAIGLALVLRDAVHSQLGPWWAVGCILVGSALSALLAPPALVAASAVAFLLSELADFAVYAPLRSRGEPVAVLMSGLAGSVVDSVLFLGIAFGSLAYAPGQIVGKVMVSLIVAAMLFVRAKPVMKEIKE